MKILITGSSGFIGKNLVQELRYREYQDLLLFDMDTPIELLDEYVKQCDFIFHLAGINRPQNPKEFMEGNYGFTTKLLNILKKYNNQAPILITSSIQAELSNDYGKSKKEAEDVLLSFSKEYGNKSLVYRLPNVFGKWCKPNYNSAVATFCNNIANDLSITVNDPKVEMKLVYIDDVVNEFLLALKGEENKKGDFCFVQPVYQIQLGEIVNKIYSFKSFRENLGVPSFIDEFEKKLYATYLSYLPKNKFSYELKMNKDDRGSFTEFVRTKEYGQFSINIAKPGITKGNHWHHTKNEKFLVVSGQAVVRFRKIDEKEIISYYVSGDKLEVVDIPVGYTHNIQNIGTSDLVTIMWANEPFDPNKPDTTFLKVEE